MNLTSIHEYIGSSLALLSELRIRHCRGLWCRSQMWLGSYIAVAVAQASNYSSDQTPSLGTSICCGHSPKKTKDKKKKDVCQRSASKAGVSGRRRVEKDCPSECPILKCLSPIELLDVDCLWKGKTSGGSSLQLGQTLKCKSSPPLKGIWAVHPFSATDGLQGFWPNV